MMKKLQKKKNNKGFSLVELIVVIAIMAILVGVLAPTVMGQIEKSRYSKDVQALDGVNTALQMVVSDEKAWAELTTGTNKLTFTSGSWSGDLSELADATKFPITDEVIKQTFDYSNILGASGKLVSEAFAGTEASGIAIVLGSNGTITSVKIISNASNTTKYPDYEH